MLLRLFKLLSLFPLPVLHATGAALGWLTYALSPTYRRRMRDNLRQAGYLHLLPQAIAESGKGVFELPFIWCADQGRVLRSVKVANWEVAQAAIDAGRGVIFLTPHLGCFEVTAQVLYRPPRKEVLSPLLEVARARGQMSLAPANLGGVRMLMKVLKKGGAIGLLPDQVPLKGEGVWTAFFGKPAYTMTLPAKLQQMSGAQLMLAYAERLPGGKGYSMHFVPFNEELRGTPEEQARAVNAAMERVIDLCPAQYLWSYNRYKVRREPPPAQGTNGAGGTNKARGAQA